MPDLLEESSLRYPFIPGRRKPINDEKGLNSIFWLSRTPLLPWTDLSYGLPMNLVSILFSRQSLLQMLLIFSGVAVMALLSAIVDWTRRKHWLFPPSKAKSTHQMGILSRTSSDLTFQGNFIAVELSLPQSGNTSPSHRRKKRSDIYVDALKCAKYQRVCTDSCYHKVLLSYYDNHRLYTAAQGSWYDGISSKMSHLLLLVWMLIDFLPKYQAQF